MHRVTSRLQDIEHGDAQAADELWRGLTYNDLPGWQRS